MMLLYCNYSIAYETKIHTHGYIGTKSIDVNDKAFDLYKNTKEPLTNLDGVVKSKKRTKKKCKFKFNDIHFHPLNFVMQGKSLEENIVFMDQNCINNSLVSSLPLLKTWQEGYKERPTYYADDDAKLYWNNMSDIPIFNQWEKLPVKHKSRFHFLINGFNHTDKNSINYINTIIELFPNVPIVGIGEIMGKHDKLSDQTYGGTSRADHPALDKIYKLSAQKNWFILLHNNLGHQVFGNKKSKLNYLAQIENALKKYKDTLFILAHGGVSRNIVIPDLTVILDGLLKKYENLYIDISWVIYENYIVPDGKVAAEWIEFINKNSNKILIGTDNVGGYKSQDYNVKKYIILLDTLNKEVADKIAYTNYEFLINRAIHK